MKIEFVAEVDSIKTEYRQMANVGGKDATYEQRSKDARSSPGSFAIFSEEPMRFSVEVPIQQAKGVSIGGKVRVVIETVE